MSPSTARTVANLLVAAAVAGGAWVLLRHPARRRRAGRMLKLAVTTWVPAYLTNEVRRAWEESGRASRRYAPVA